MKAYWTSEKAAAEAEGDAVKATYATWKLDPRNFKGDWHLLRQAGLRFRDRNAENAADRGLGSYVGD